MLKVDRTEVNKTIIWRLSKIVSILITDLSFLHLAAGMTGFIGFPFGVVKLY
jgi:hypothetical protein